MERCKGAEWKGAKCEWIGPKVLSGAVQSLSEVAVEVREAAETSPDQCEAECSRVENSRSMQCSSEGGTTKVMESPGFTGWPSPPQRVKNHTVHSGLDSEESSPGLAEGAWYSVDMK